VSLENRLSRALDQSQDALANLMRLATHHALRGALGDAEAHARLVERLAAAATSIHLYAQRRQEQGRQSTRERREIALAKLMAQIAQVEQAAHESALAELHHQGWIDPTIWG
jgi:Tfp pilus assembly protein PilF